MHFSSHINGPNASWWFEISSVCGLLWRPRSPMCSYFSVRSCEGIHIFVQSYQADHTNTLPLRNVSKRLSNRTTLPGCLRVEPFYRSAESVEPTQLYDCAAAQIEAVSSECGTFSRHNPFINCLFVAANTTMAGFEMEIFLTPPLFLLATERPWCPGNSFVEHSVASPSLIHGRCLSTFS